MRSSRRPVHIRRKLDELFFPVDPPPRPLRLRPPPVQAHVAEQRLGLIALLPRQFENEGKWLLPTLQRPQVLRNGLLANFGT